MGTEPNKYLSKAAKKLNVPPEAFEIWAITLEAYVGESFELLDDDGIIEAHTEMFNKITGGGNA